MFMIKKTALAAAAMLIGALALQGCDKTGSGQNAAVAEVDARPTTVADVRTADSTVATPDTAVSTQPAYVPPTAAQMIQLLAPVAVFPDTLVAQVLAASAYPDQIGAANAWLAQNASLKGAALQQALDQQAWDASVKALVVFPDVLHQMAGNPTWTAALGDAYVNDPADVMNAIQSLRQQALACGSLKSNKYLSVTRVTKSPPPAQPIDDTAWIDDDLDARPTYAGPPVFAPPEDVIEIAPTQPDVVYVPTWDPAVFYGRPIAPWPGYAYAWPAPLYIGPAFGRWAFGGGISIGIGFGHPWGWGGWGVHWGPGFGRYGWDRGFRGPAVVFNNHVYVNRSTTVINHFERGNPAAAGGRAFAGHAIPGGPVAPAAHATSFVPQATARTSSAAAAGRPLTTPQFTRAMATPTRAVASAKTGPVGRASAVIGAPATGSRAANPASTSPPTHALAATHAAPPSRNLVASTDRSTAHASSPNLRGVASSATSRGDVAATRGFAAAGARSAPHYAAASTRAGYESDGARQRYAAPRASFANVSRGVGAHSGGRGPAAHAANRGPVHASNHDGGKRRT